MFFFFQKCECPEILNDMELLRQSFANTAATTFASWANMTLHAGMKTGFEQANIGIKIYYTVPSTL